MHPKLLHQISFAIGSVFFLLSIWLALAYRYPHFYTSFALGSFLILDWFDFRLNGGSILGYFFNHKHRDAFVIFFFFTTLFCFVVDYIYGVRLSGMWQWADYRTVHFYRMYIFMNASYVLGMYSLFRVVRTIFSHRISSKHLINYRNFFIPPHTIHMAMVGLGSFFLLLPLYVMFFETKRLIEYFMFFPFVGMLFVSDGFTGLLGGKPILYEVARVNRLQIFSLIFTAVFAAFVTEALNLYGGEWHYLRMPFPEWGIFNIPFAVFIGWIPLVVGAISVVNLMKRLDDVRDARKRMRLINNGQ